MFFVVMAVLAAILGVFKTTFGLSLDVTALLAGITGVLVYVYGEAKADMARARAQAGKWTDPKFWLTIVTAVVTALATAGVALPVSPEVIVAILTAIVGILFKVKPSVPA
jgi:hypothetical protein